MIPDKVFIRKPSIDRYPGIRVTKDTEFTFESEDKSVKQTLSDLVLHSVTNVKGDSYESVYDTTIYLKEGDVLIFDGDNRGYVMPVESFVSIADAIEDLKNIKDLG